jgi:L-threonylcarbamoyladenylate synthase
MGTGSRRVSVIYFISKLNKWDDLRMEIIKNPSPAEIKKAAKALKDGHLVAFPTETVYGLGADAANEKAVARIYDVKARPTNHPLIVHVSSINLLENWSKEIPEYAIKLAKEFWPGPMTLVLPRTDLAKNFITGGQSSIGIRVPSHPIALSLLKHFESLGGFGVTAPSANRFGAVSPTSSTSTTEEIGTYLSNMDLILDGGNCVIGLESTIIGCLEEQPVILRPGIISNSMVAQVTGLKIQEINSGLRVKSSGQFKSHYAPRARVVLDVKPEPGDGFLALADIPTPEGTIRLGAPGDVNQYAKILYAALRDGDKKNLRRIVAILPNGSGLALAIRDRLVKSSG